MCRYSFNMVKVFVCVLALTLTAAAQVKTELLSNNFVTHNYFLVTAKFTPGKKDSTLYLPTLTNRSSKLDGDRAAAYLRIRAASSSPFEYILPVSTVIKQENGETIPAGLFLTLPAGANGVEVEFLFRVPVVNHDQRMRLLNLWYPVPYYPNLLKEDSDFLTVKNKALEMKESSPAAALDLFFLALALDKSVYTELLLPMVECETALAKSYIESGQPEKALIYLTSANEGAAKMSPEIRDEISTLLVRCYGQLGDKSLAVDKPGEALSYYKSGSEYNGDKSVFSKKMELIEGEKTPAWQSIMLGLLPGTPQFFKSEYAKSGLMLGLFGSSLVIFSDKIDEAKGHDKTALQYQKVIDGSTGESRLAANRLKFSEEQEAQRKRNIAYASLAVGGITMLWSIYDAIYNEDVKYKPVAPEPGLRFLLGGSAGNAAVSMQLVF